MKTQTVTIDLTLTPEHERKNVARALLIESNQFTPSQVDAFISDLSYTAIHVAFRVMTILGTEHLYSLQQNERSEVSLKVFMVTPHAWATGNGAYLYESTCDPRTDRATIEALISDEIKNMDNWKLFIEERSQLTTETHCAIWNEKLAELQTA